MRGGFALGLAFYVRTGYVGVRMRRAPIKRGPGPTRQTRLRRVGKRARRELADIVRFRRAVLAQAGYRCERCGVGERERRIEAHHYLPRSRGGTHDPSNGIALCFICHDGAHRHLDDWRRWIA